MNTENDNDDVELPLIAPPVPKELLEAAAKVELSDSEREFAEHSAAVAAEREKLMPDTSSLKSAVSTDGAFIPAVGDTVVMERRSVLLQGMPWLDTRLLVVKRVDSISGDVLLFDAADLKQFVRANFITGPSRGVFLKIPAKRGNPLGGPLNQVVTKAVVEEDDSKPVKKKGRGRPKGTKNRPKAIIAAEKRERAAMKKAKKVAKKKGR